MENGNHKWQDAMHVEMAQIKEYGVFKERQNGNGRPSPMLLLDTRRSEFILGSQLNTAENLRGDWLLIAT